jgi:hypothetical protein
MLNGAKRKSLRPGRKADSHAHADSSGCAVQRFILGKLPQLLFRRTRVRLLITATLFLSCKLSKEQVRETVRERERPNAVLAVVLPSLKNRKMLSEPLALFPHSAHGK